MPFDHALCPGCQAMLDPERLNAGPRGPVCPKCQTPLSLVDLFGVADAFSEEEGEKLSLDDLVPGSRPAPKTNPSTTLSLDALIPGRRR